MIPPCSWAVPGQETRNVHERQQREIERVAEPNEPRRLGRSIDVEGAREDARIVRDDSDRPPGEARETDHDVRGPLALHLEERLAVEDAGEHLVHVVRGIGILGHDAGQLGRRRIRGRRRRREGGLFEVIEGQIGEEPSGERDRFGIGARGEVGDPAQGRVGVRPAERVHRDLFTGDGADDVRAGDEHLAGPFRHDHEVGDRGRVDRSAGARAEDQGDLGNDPREGDVPEEHLPVAAEAHDALLDARAAGVVESHDRHPGLPCGLHDLHDLHRVRLAKRPAEDGRVLGERADRAPVDLPPAGNDAIAGGPPVREAELLHSVGDERVDLGEGARVEERFEALACGELARGSVLFDPLAPSALACLAFQDCPPVERFAHATPSTRTSPALMATRSDPCSRMSSPSSPSPTIVPAARPSTPSGMPGAEQPTPAEPLGRLDASEALEPDRRPHGAPDDDRLNGVEGRRRQDHLGERRRALADLRRELRQVRRHVDADAGDLDGDVIRTVDPVDEDSRDLPRRRGGDDRSRSFGHLTEKGAEYWSVNSWASRAPRARGRSVTCSTGARRTIEM